MTFMGALTPPPLVSRWTSRLGEALKRLRARLYRRQLKRIAKRYTPVITPRVSVPGLERRVQAARLQ